MITFIQFQKLQTNLQSQKADQQQCGVPGTKRDDYNKERKNSVGHWKCLFFFFHIDIKQKQYFWHGLNYERNQFALLQKLFSHLFSILSLMTLYYISLPLSLLYTPTANVHRKKMMISSCLKIMYSRGISYSSKSLFQFNTHPIDEIPSYNNPYIQSAKFKMQNILQDKLLYFCNKSMSQEKRGWG